MLSCSCPDEGPSYYIPPDDFEPLKGKKRKRCKSCKQIIELGAPVLRFSRAREPVSDVEIRIHGVDAWVPLANWFLCESCGDQYMNLEALGFCVHPEDNMFALIQEYNDTYRRSA